MNSLGRLPLVLGLVDVSVNDISVWIFIESLAAAWLFYGIWLG